MDVLTDRAAAKVNLALRVLGKRADGYHELESLVGFAGVCDRLELAPGDDLALTAEGPFVAALGNGNLVLDAARRLCERCPGIRTGAFKLEKNLPVAAGLGGGSADAAAALRLLARANPGRIALEAVEETARALGSDVSVCLASRAAVMRGRGDELIEVENFPALPAVLANPGVALGAGEVYAALGAAPLDDRVSAQKAGPVSFASAGDVARHIRETGNDLAPAAEKRVPAIADVRAALAATADCLVAQMSGSGASCFAIHETVEAAQSAARTLAAAHPGWWVVATEIG